MSSYARSFIEGKQYSQDSLTPIALLILGAQRRPSVKENVEEQVYDMLRAEFKKDIYHEKVANSSVERRKHDVAWARERAKQNHGYIKSGAGAVRGTWESSGKGKAYYDRSVTKLKRTIKDSIVSDDVAVD